MEQQTPQPSQEIQQFLGGFFNTANQTPLSINAPSTNYQQPEMAPINTGTKLGAETSYSDIVNKQNMSENILIGKVSKPIEIDPSNLFTPSAPSKTAQEALQGIRDIKSRGDQIDIIDRSAISREYNDTVSGGGGMNTNNVTNNSNITNVTQVTTEYLFKIRSDYMRLPPWREVMG